MAKLPPSYIIELKDLLIPLGEVIIKAMFGGYGVYVNGLFIGIAYEEQLYLKVDDETRPTFEARGLAPFIVQQRGRMIAMDYHLVPDEALTSFIKMKPWATLAIQAALRALNVSPPKKKAPASRKKT